MIETEGIVLNELKIKESSKILKVYSRQLGLISIYAKGALRKSSPFTASSQIFSHNSYRLKKQGNFFYIQKATIISLNYDLRKDYESFIYGSMIVELYEKSNFESEINKKTFPGYVLVELVMTDESWFIVRNTPGVTGFVGSHGGGSKPEPLLPEEINFILKEMGLASISEIDMEKGDRVKIISGPFSDMEGIVSNIDLPNYKVDVLIELMGRSTKVELELYHVEKITNY